MPRRRKGRRALGPYPHGNGWRVIIIEPRGKGASARHPEPFATRPAALAFKEEFNARAALDGITVREAIAKYERHYLVGRGNKPRSWADTRWRIERLVSDLDLELDAITPRKAAAMYQARVDAGDAADSHRGYLTHTKTFFGWCVKQGWLDANPFDAVEAQGRKRKGRDQLRRDELRIWLHHAYEVASAGEWRALAAMLTLMLGMRAGEIVSRRVRDLDDDATVLWVEGKSEAGRRVLQVPDVLQPLLRLHAAGKGGEERMFPVGYRVVNEWVGKICAGAGVRRVVAHSMRGAHSSLAVEEGASSHAVARAMGHETFQVTAAHYVSHEAKAAAGQRRVEKTFGVIRGGKR